MIERYSESYIVEDQYKIKLYCVFGWSIFGIKIKDVI